MRKAAYEGLRSVGTFVVDNGFIELIRLRNALARALGYQDFYDYKVRNRQSGEMLNSRWEMEQLACACRPRSSSPTNASTHHASHAVLLPSPALSR